MFRRPVNKSRSSRRFSRSVRRTKVLNVRSVQRGGYRL